MVPADSRPDVTARLVNVGAQGLAEPEASMSGGDVLRLVDWMAERLPQFGGSHVEGVPAKAEAFCGPRLDVEGLAFELEVLVSQV